MCHAIRTMGQLAFVTKCTYPTQKEKESGAFSDEDLNPDLSHERNCFSSIMNKKSHKKKKKKGNGRGKENSEVEPDGREQEDDCGWSEKEKEVPIYEIRTSDVMGRYIVASRNIEPGEVIIQTPALVIGPCTGCNILCLGCYRELDETRIYKCPDCKWPLCSGACAGRGAEHGHSAHECAALRQAAPDYANMEDLKDSYQAIAPLRCLLLKELSPAKWAAVSAMEPHTEIRRRRADIWDNNETHVVRRLVRRWGFRFDADEVHRVCGILEVNAFEVGVSGASARGLYDRAYLLAHDCTPSTTHTDLEGAPGRPLTVRAAVPHRPGDLISLCYAYTLQGTLQRREHILHSKFFECGCARCADPAELGTHASALRCPRCARRVLPAAPLDAHAPWECTCGYAMPAAAVRVLLKRLTEEYEQIDANDVPGYEGFLHKYRNVLCPTHYLCLCCKHSLSQLYGKTSAYMIQEMPVEELNRKIEICRDIMKAFDVIEPGYSRLRGITLYELHAPLMILTTRDFEKKLISKENLRTRLKEIVGYLKESERILGLEPPQSSEGLMAAAARDALRRIKTWEKIIGKI